MSRPTGGRSRNALRNSPRQPTPSPSCSQISIKKNMSRLPHCLLAILRQHRSAPLAEWPREPAPGSVPGSGSLAGAPAADPATLRRAPELRAGKRRRVPPPAVPACSRLARSAARQDKVKNKQITTFTAAAAIALRKIIQAL